MKWRTAIEPMSFPFQITLETDMLLLGSCFAEHIGQKMTYHKFRNSVNPTGISYNPLSLAENIDRALQQRVIVPDELNHNGQKYIHFDFHGSLGHHLSDVCLDQINASLIQLNQAIIQSQLIFISLGSTIVFARVSDQTIVSNCHKFPQETFIKRQLNKKEIEAALQNIVQNILQSNEKAQIIFTVSPIRHARHGLVENNRSKANLISAVHDIVDQKQAVQYFPSYEILMDDLRDYRFYNRDLVHPSEEAIDYVWDYLKEQSMSDHTKQELKSLKSLIDSYHHKTMNTDPKLNHQYLSELKQKMIAHQYHDRFTQEISDIEDQMLTLLAP